MNKESLKPITQNFFQELQDAREGKPSSLRFIRHTVDTKAKVAEGEIFQVIRIGGSIYQNALLRRDNDILTIIQSVQEPLPVFHSEDVLLAFMKKHIDPNISHLALNFAYPMTPVPRGGLLDGTLLSGSKEHEFRGLVGKNVGEIIEKSFPKRDLHVAVANDTVCLLLSGLTQQPWNRLAGGIIGTGLNFAIFLDENTAINLESANFDKFTQSKEGKLIDETSANPGHHPFEKETAGGYLYKHFNAKLKEHNIDFAEIASTKELDQIAAASIPNVSVLAREVSEHSSSLVSCQIAAITQFYGRDTMFIIEGSLFWKGFRYKENVGILCRELVPQYNVSFVFIEESGVMGAAKLVA